jgi:phosphoglycolate phosphatase
MKYKAIVFDFDGTLVDSNLLKRTAFDHVFSDRPDCLPHVDSVLLEWIHGSRYEIIRALTRKIKDLSETEMEIEAQKRTETYSNWVETHILLKASESPASELLTEWKKLSPLYICSLTPVEPLKQALIKMGWFSCFSGVKGYPIRKEEMLRQTAEQHNAKPREILMVGDGNNDEEAARLAGTDFFRITTLLDLFNLDKELKKQ